MKKAYIVHRWDGNPKADWYPWVKRELEKRGYKVEIPKMPNPEAPKIKDWVSYLRRVAKRPNEETIFIGHSIGCQTILRFLEGLSSQVKVKSVLLVAPWMNLVNLSSEEERQIAEPWLKTPIRWEKVRPHSNKFVAWFSDNDPWVPLSDAQLFRQKLGAKVFVEKKMGHFTDEDGVTKLPQLLQEF